MKDILRGGNEEEGWEFKVRRECGRKSEFAENPWKALVMRPFGRVKVLV